LILASLGAVALAFGSRSLTFVIATIAALWTALVMYQLPGSLVNEGGIGIAEMSWGAFLALAGSLVLALAAWSRPRPDTHRMGVTPDPAP